MKHGHCETCRNKQDEEHAPEYDASAYGGRSSAEFCGEQLTLDVEIVCVGLDSAADADVTELPR